MPVSASPLLAPSSAKAGLISWKPAAARHGDRRKPVVKVRTASSQFATADVLPRPRSTSTRSQSSFTRIRARQPYSTAPAAPSASISTVLRQACRVWHTRGRIAPTNRIGARQCDPCCNAGRAKQQQFCANRVVTTAARAGSDDALNAPADKAFRSLAQVTTPSDGLPDPSSCWTAQYGPSTCPLPAGSVRSSAVGAHP